MPPRARRSLIRPRPVTPPPAPKIAESENRVRLHGRAGRLGETERARPEKRRHIAASHLVQLQVTGHAVSGNTTFNSIIYRAA